MLDQSLADPDGVESSTREAPGLGLLPMRTTFGAVQRTRRVRVRAIAGVGPFARLGDTSVAGYELHMGCTDGGNAPLFRVAGEGEAERADGCRSGDGMVAGTYLHGLFEHAPVRQALIGWLGARRGLAARSRDSALAGSRVRAAGCDGAGRPRPGCGLPPPSP
jgi:adenosylcobyric acid synthase